MKWSTTRYNQAWVNTCVNRLARHKKVFPQYRFKHRLIWLDKQMKQDTRRVFNSYLMDILVPVSVLNTNHLYTYV